MNDLMRNVFLMFAVLSLFIQFCAVVSLQATAAYVFGGAAILFAVLTLIVCLAE